MKRANKQAAGFTIIEAVIGMGIVGILIVAVYGLQMSIYSKVQVGREDLRATQIMVKKIDQMRLFSWDQVTDGSTVPTSFTETFDPEEDLPRNRGLARKTFTYQGTVAIDDGPSGVAYSSDMKQVTVTLQWTTAAGHPRTRTATTYVARYGLQNYIY